MEKPIVAIMYDFDKTLSVTDMQNYSFIPNLGITPDEFWGATKEFKKNNGVESTLSYMYVMLDLAKKKGINVTKEYLNECGKNIEFFPGVETWFDRINKFGEENGVQVEHYLVSSGTKEIVEGCKIYPYFKKAWGCEFYFNEQGEPVWPKHAINYTLKTQFFYRITKGVSDDNDDDSVNAKSPKLRVLPENIIYCGDGMTDIPCMILVHESRGTSIALYSEKTAKQIVDKIYSDKRCDYIAQADYTPGGDMETIIQLVIRKIALNIAMKEKEIELAKK